MNPDSTLASYLRTVCPDADLSGVSSEALAFAAALDVVGEVAPEIADGHRGRAGRPAGQPQADRQRELRLPGHAAGHGQLAVATSTPRARPATASTPAATTSTPSSAGPSSWPRACSAADHAYVQPHSGIDANLVAFWSILTKRVEAPALERLGAKDLQRPVGRRLGDAAPRARQPADAGHGARRRRPPDPRLPAQRLRQAVRPALATASTRDRPARLRRGRARAARESGR